MKYVNVELIIFEFLQLNFFNTAKNQAFSTLWSITSF